MAEDLKFIENAENFSARYEDARWSGENTVLITELAGEEPECMAAAAITPIISTTSTPTNILNAFDL